MGGPIKIGSRAARLPRSAAALIMEFRSMPALLPASRVRLASKPRSRRKTTIDTLACCRPIWNALFSSHTIWEPQMQFARIAIAIAVFFTCFKGTPSFAESCSQVGQQCYSIYGRWRVNLSFDFQKKQCAAATEECKARCKQGFKAFIIPATSVKEPVDSCN